MEGILAHARNTRSLERELALAREPSPLLHQKSPTFHQNSPIFHQQSPIFQKCEKSICQKHEKSRARNIWCTRAQCCIKRGLFLFCIKRALRCLERQRRDSALCFINKALCPCAFIWPYTMQFAVVSLYQTRNLKPRVFPPFSTPGCKQGLLAHLHTNTTRTHSLSHFFTSMRDPNSTFPLFGLGRIFFKFGKHLWGEFVSVTCAPQDVPRQ